MSPVGHPLRIVEVGGRAARTFNMLSSFPWTGSMEWRHSRRPVGLEEWIHVRLRHQHGRPAGRPAIPGRSGPLKPEPSMPFDVQLREIHPKTRAGWRSWLKENHAKCEGVWLIYFRESTGERRLSWEDAVREALCFGWIDSKIKPIDDMRSKQMFTPRKPRSVWSKVNKRYIAELVEAGLMTAAGMPAVEIAEPNGAWSMLEPVDALSVPTDLQSALRGSKTARESYEALSDPAKRSLLYSVYSAKREDWRAKRLAKVPRGPRA